MSEVTRILSAAEQGDPHAAEQLLPLVYDELRKLAAARLASEAPGQTLQPTALVHEAYLRLVEPDPAGAAAPLPGLPPAGGLDEDAAHRLGGGREEVAAGVPPPVSAADEPEVRLVDQGGRLEGLARGLGGQPGGGQLAQLGVHEGEQVGRGVRIAAGGRVEQAGDVGHGARVHAPERGRKDLPADEVRPCG